MKKNAVLLASHGHLAKYALDSAQMVMGKLENCDYLSVTIDVTPEDAKKLVEQKIGQLDTSAGLVILVDVFGGTPSNIATEVLMQGTKCISLKRTKPACADRTVYAPGNAPG